jgi:hypothetical protein
MTAAEVNEWRAYARSHPFGPLAAWNRNAIVASLVANAMRDPKQRAQPFTPADFMPKVAAPMMPEDIKKARRAEAAAIKAMFGVGDRQDETIVGAPLAGAGRKKGSE